VEQSSHWSRHAHESLRAAGFRAGGARSAVVELLGGEPCCLTAQEIFDRSRAAGRPVGIASVYRVLDLLTEMRLVQRIDLGSGIARFEAAQPDGEHHHHTVCDDCGRVEAFSDARLELALDQVAGDVGFSVQAHDVVLRGACSDCSD
jgi:Fur family ferric uptake transcriptional regulator